MAETPIRLLSPAQEEELRRHMDGFKALAAAWMRQAEEKGPELRKILDSLRRG